MPKERLLWLDFLKLVAIFLVVLGHVIRHCGLSINDWDSVCGWIYSFHMPLFMTLSGYVSYKLCEGVYDIKRKFRQLIIPCIVLWVICLLIGHNENFWYLKSLFFCYVITAFLFSLKIRYKYILLLLACIGVFPIISRVPYVSSWKIDFMLPFFLFGILVNKKIEYIKNHIQFITLLSCGLFVVLWMFWTPEYVYYNSQPVWFDYKFIIDRSLTFFHIDAIIRVVYRYLIGFAGTMTFICLTLMGFEIKKTNKIISFLSRWGVFSLYIYILQSFIVQYEKLPVVFPTDNKFLFFFVYTPLYSFIVVVVCICAAILIKKVPLIDRYIFGKI